MKKKKTSEDYYDKIKQQLGSQALLSFQTQGGRLYGKEAMCKMLEDYHQAKLKEIKALEE